ncbi:high choriolytic enzyme 1-like [Chaetodon trifascialis]|uniref:high choriolytic enzyme 1-like n=1 Tax=Chaetodon trifascialis TaxID=109706 RepID=UPI003990FF62
MDMKCILGLVVLLAVSAWAEEQINQVLSTSERIERANRNIVQSPGELYIEDDIAYRSKFERNADPCTASGCMWPKSSDGNVYIPYIISNVYSSREVAIIERGLQSFHDLSCIRFVRRTSQRDYLNIQSLSGCYSYIGRVGYEQELSLQQSSYVYYDTIQHEVLHALGFNHEQTHSNRDQYIRVEWQNITPGSSVHSQSLNLLNQETTYDYGSVMHYGKFGFSSNGQPTMVAIPDANVEFGMATEMSEKDIIQLNQLYGC